MKRPLLLLFTLFCLSGVGFAYQSPEAFIEELDGVLTPKVMGALVPNGDVIDVARLAQEEDMEPGSDYLISDQLLRRLKRSMLKGTEFSRVMEAFQAECDRLDAQKRAEAIALFRSYWLERVMEHLRYVKSLKSVWGVYLTQSIDYNSNVTLLDLSDLNDFNQATNGDPLGLRDTGLSLAGGVTYMPLINHNRNKPWDYKVNAAMSSQTQSLEESIEYDTATLTQTLSWKEPVEGIRRASLSWGFMRAWSQNPENPRMDFEHHAFTLAASSDVKAMKGYFGARSQNISLQLRLKNEFRDQPNAGAEIDVQAVKLGYGWTYLKVEKNEPFQSLSWKLSLEQDRTDVESDVIGIAAARLKESTRDYTAYGMTVRYNRGVPELLPEYGVSWTTVGGVRFKSWDPEASVPAPDEKENQFRVATSLKATWNRWLSSSIEVAYLHRQRDRLNDAAYSYDQWRLVWTNQFIHF